MSRLNYSDEEKTVNSVLAYQDRALRNIQRPNSKKLEERISASEKTLSNLGYPLPERNQFLSFQADLVVPTWEELSSEAIEQISTKIELEDLFSEDELRLNSLTIKELNKQYNEIHRLDELDILIAVSAGLLASAVDILLVGVPEKTSCGLKAGSLSNYIRDAFDKKFPPDEIEKLANSKVSKVPFDAQDNRNTTINIGGLSAYYHRLLSLGHDPLLGFVFGVADILTGHMTTIDKTGKVVSQVMECYADRTEMNIFSALVKQLSHLKSDVTTSMGLPAPLMGLFNLLQFGSIGEYEQTIADIVQGMHFEGYDFIHFCSMSVSAIIIEVVVRIGYAVKRIKEGSNLKDAIPFDSNHTEKPKLGTMLFAANAIAAAVNAGKIAFTKSPLSINYPQWIAFAKYSFQQARWILFTNPELRDQYIREAIAFDLDEIYEQIDTIFNEIQLETITL